jgi:hypothetical protein
LGFGLRGNHCIFLRVQEDIGIVRGRHGRRLIAHSLRPLYPFMEVCLRTRPHSTRGSARVSIQNN